MGYAACVLSPPPIICLERPHKTRPGRLGRNVFCIRVSRFLTGPEDAARQAERGSCLTPNCEGSQSNESHSPGWLFYFTTYGEEETGAPQSTHRVAEAPG